MKVMCIYSPCGPEFVRKGWGNVFKTLGHDFIFWQTDRKPAFDAFDEVEPDLFIGTTYDMDDATFKCIKERAGRGMKVILFGSCHGTLVWDMDLRTYPIQVASPKELDLIKRLKDETGQPEFVFIHYHEHDIPMTMGGWDRQGIKSVGIMNAADTIDYPQGSPNPRFDCDLAFVGGYWPYKARNLDRFILPLCNGEYRVKLFGNQKWPVYQYGGLIDTPDVKDLFCSAKVCPNVSEPHSTTYGFDIIERPFKVLAAGGFCVSDYVESAVDRVFHGTLPSAREFEDFKAMIDHYIANPEEREKKRKEGQRVVLSEHTYFHRVAQMLTELSMDDEAAKCLEIANGLVSKL